MRTLHAITGLLLLVLGIGGCFFETRDPQSGDDVEVCYESVSSKEVDFVFENMNGSMDCLQLSSYEDQLGPDFIFIPAPSVADNYPSVFAEEWDKEKESEWLNRLFSEADSLVSDLRLEDISPPSGTTEVIVEASYSLRFVKDGSSIVYSGEAFYTLIQSATVWYITRWEEKESAIGKTPLGDLRGSMVQ